MSNKNTASKGVGSTGGSALDRALAYSPGQDCGCCAYGQSECGCSADWTPRINKIVAAWRDMPAAEMRMRCGELTAQEIRTVRAVLKQILPPNASDEPRPLGAVGSGPWLGASGSSTTQDAAPTQAEADHP